MYLKKNQNAPRLFQIIPQDATMFHTAPTYLKRYRRASHGTTSNNIVQICTTVSITPVHHALLMFIPLQFQLFFGVSMYGSMYGSIFVCIYNTWYVHTYLSHVAYMCTFIFVCWYSTYSLNMYLFMCVVCICVPVYVICVFMLYVSMCVFVCIYVFLDVSVYVICEFVYLYLSIIALCTYLCLV